MTELSDGPRAAMVRPESARCLSEPPFSHLSGGHGPGTVPSAGGRAGLSGLPFQSWGRQRGSLEDGKQLVTEGLRGI